MGVHNVKHGIFSPGGNEFVLSPFRSKSTSIAMPITGQCKPDPRNSSEWSYAWIPLHHSKVCNWINTVSKRRKIDSVIPLDLRLQSLLPSPSKTTYRATIRRDSSIIVHFRQKKIHFRAVDKSVYRFTHFFMDLSPRNDAESVLR